MKKQTKFHIGEVVWWKSPDSNQVYKAYIEKIIKKDTNETEYIVSIRVGLFRRCACISKEHDMNKVDNLTAPAMRENDIDISGIMQDVSSLLKSTAAIEKKMLRKVKEHAS